MGLVGVCLEIACVGTCHGLVIGVVVVVLWWWLRVVC